MVWWLFGLIFNDMPKEAEKKALADKAVLFVQRKLEQGWVPWAGVLEYEEELTQRQHPADGSQLLSGVYF
jgi:hypothetical protein